MYRISDYLLISEDQKGSDAAKTFEHKGHIGEVIASLLIITKPPLIRNIPRWVAREAGPAGRSCRAGRVSGAGQAGQSSSRGALSDGRGRWTSRAGTTNLCSWF